VAIFSPGDILFTHEKEEKSQEMKETFIHPSQRRNPINESMEKGVVYFSFDPLCSESGFIGVEVP